MYTQDSIPFLYEVKGHTHLIHIESMAAPILRLRAGAYLSSVTCNTTEEEKELYDAALQFQNLPILWYRKVRPKPNVNLINPGTGLVVMKRQKSMVHEMVDDVKGLLELSPQKSGEEDQMYIGMDAVLSLCDTDTGPAIEIHSTASAASRVMDKYDFADIVDEMDVVTSFIGTQMKSPRISTHIFSQNLPLIHF